MADSERLRMLLNFRSEFPLKPREICEAQLYSRQAVDRLLGRKPRHDASRMRGIECDVKRIVWAEIDSRFYFEDESDIFCIQEKYNVDERDTVSVRHTLVNRGQCLSHGISRSDRLRGLPSGNGRSSSPLGRPPAVFGSLQVLPGRTFRASTPVYDRNPIPLVPSSN